MELGDLVIIVLVLFSKGCVEKCEFCSKLKNGNFEKRSVFKYMSIAEISRSDKFAQKSSFFNTPHSASMII